LKDYEFIEIKMDKIELMNEINLRDFYYQNKSILSWKKNQIFLRKINSNNGLEIIKTNKYSYNIISIYLSPNIIFYNSSAKKENGEDKNEDNNGDNNKDSNENNIEDSNEDSDEDSL